MKTYVPALLTAFLMTLSATSAGVLSAREGGFQAASPAQGTPSGKSGGFSGPGIEVTTVTQALGMRDDTNVILQGNIVRSLGGEKYIFRDATGESAVDIDDHLWAGNDVTPETRVELHCELDKDFMDATEIDVGRIIILN